MFYTEPPAPRTCPRGHLLGPYRMLVKWQRCDCPAALEHYHGHRTFECQVCRRQGWTTICYRPEHVPRR